MDKPTKIVLALLVIAAIFGPNGAEWFIKNVILGSIMFFIEIMEWVVNSQELAPILGIIVLLWIIIKTGVGDYILSKLGF